MRMHKKGNQAVALLVAATLVVTGVTVPGQMASAKSKMKLSKKKITIRVGQKKKLKLKHASGKVKWKSSKKKVASVTKKGVVKGKKAGKAKIIAKCGKKKFVCRVTVRKNTAIDAGAQVSAAPGSTLAPGATAAPSVSASAKPGKSAEPTASATTISTKTKPTTAQADTLAIGTFSVTLGMTKAQVESAMGAKPDKTGKSPWGCDVYVYNPSMDYTNYVEMQFLNDAVVEMSTISGYFCYAGIVSSQDTETALKAQGFSSMSNVDYEAGYLKKTDNSFVTAFVDHQGGGGVYALQVFSTTLTPKQDNFTKPSYCSYDASVLSSMQSELPDYINAFRVFKGVTPMKESTVKAAQEHADEMASKGKTQTSSADGTSWKDRFKDTYGDYYKATEFVADSCPDAFSFAVFAVDYSDGVASGSTSTIYQYMSQQMSDSDGVQLDFSISCGFAYNASTSLKTFATIDMYSF